MAPAAFSLLRLLIPAFVPATCALQRVADLLLLVLLLQGSLRKFVERHRWRTCAFIPRPDEILLGILILFLLLVPVPPEAKIAVLTLLHAWTIFTKPPHEAPRGNSSTAAAEKVLEEERPRSIQRSRRRSASRDSSHWADGIGEAYFVCGRDLQLSFCNKRGQSTLQDYEGEFPRMVRELVLDDENERCLENVILDLLDEPCADTNKCVKVALDRISRRTTASGSPSQFRTSLFKHYRAALWKSDNTVLMILKEKDVSMRMIREGGMDTAMYCTVSHELRTLLNAVIMNLVLLEDDLPAGLRTYQKIAQSSTKILASKLNDLLDSIQIQNKTFRVHRKEFDVPALVAEVNDVCGWQAKQKQVGIEIVMDKDTVKTMVGDEDRIRQVVFSLMLSAIQLTEWGMVKLNVERKKTRTVTFKVLSKGAGTQSKLLEQIRRSSQSETKKRLSSKKGEQETVELLDELPLEISQSICNEMGARITAKGQNGEVRFRFDVLDGFLSSRAGEKREGAVRKYSADDRHDDFALYRVSNPFNLANEQGDNSVSSTRLNVKTDCVCLTELEAIPDEFPLSCPVIRVPSASFIGNKTGSVGLTRISSEKVHPRPLWVKLPADPEVQLSAKSPTASIANDQRRRKSKMRRTTMGGEHQARHRLVKKVSIDDDAVCHIMIVDDNVTNRFVLKELMKRYGHNSMEAKDGKDALNIMDKYVRTGAVGELLLVFMDLQMPVMNGIQATEAIISLCNVQGVAPPPIIGISSDPSEEDRRKFMVAGIREFLSKPIDKQKVQYLVKKYLSTQKAM